MQQPDAAGQTPAQLLDQLTEKLQHRQQVEAERRGGRGRGRGWHV